MRERAKVKLRQGKLEESLIAFNSAINLIKQNNIGMDTWKAQVYRAEVFMRLGQYKKAWKDISYVLLSGLLPYAVL